MTSRILNYSSPISKSRLLRIASLLLLTHLIGLPEPTYGNIHTYRTSFFRDTLPGVGSFGTAWIASGTVAHIFNNFYFEKSAESSSSGIIYTAREKTPGILSFEPSIQPTGMSDLAYVDGYVQTYGGLGTFLFPVGAAGRFRPCIIYPNGQSLQGVQAAYYEEDPTVWLKDANQGALDPQVSAFWHIKGSDQVALALPLSPLEQLLFALDSTRLALLGFRNHQWEQIPAQLVTFSSTDELGFAGQVLKSKAPVLPDSLSVFAIGMLPSTLCTVAITVDMRGNPTGVYESPALPREGKCCGATTNNCLTLEVVLDTKANGFVFELADNTTPSENLGYQVQCGAPVPLGQPSFGIGGQTYRVTFCAPEGVANRYRIRSISIPGISPREVDTDNQTIVRHRTGKDSSMVILPPGIGQDDNQSSSATHGNQPKLFQNSPNPVHSETNIRFYLPSPTHARLLVSDLSGKIILREESYYDSGLHEWNLRNGVLTAPPGIYFYTLQTETTTLSKKMVLLD